MRTFLCVALSCVLISLYQADGTATTQVTIAYVEDVPTATATKDKTLIQTNADDYMSAVIAKAKAAKTTPDIVVFPEYGLTGMTDKKDSAVKIDAKNSSSSDDLKHLHELAKTNNVILVANLLEVDDDDLYSTTVVLDGTNKDAKDLLAKYRKINLRGDDEKNLKSADEVVSFKHTTFGTIGILSGDDILYENPAKKLKENGVTTFIYTSSQKVVAPFKTTVSLHAGFAKAHEVNLVVSSLKNVDKHISGSGVYTPCGPQEPHIDVTDAYYGIVTIDVTPNNNKCDKSNFRTLLGLSPALKTKQFADIPEYDLKDLKTEKITSNSEKGHQVCDGSFCCNFTIAASDWKSENYRLVVKGGDEKICGMMMCTNGDDDKIEKSCGNIANAPTALFSGVKIVTDEVESMFRPYILHSDLTPGSDLKSTTFKVEKDKDDKGTTTFQIDTVKDVVAIGIVSATKSAASSLGIAVNVLVISVFLKYLF